MELCTDIWTECKEPLSSQAILSSPNPISIFIYIYHIPK